MARRLLRQNKPSAYTIMWILVMFDLPTTSKSDMRKATQFRNSLLELGFRRKQFSVYMRHCENMAAAQRLAEKVRCQLTCEGLVSVMFFTDKQFGLTKNYVGKVTKRNEQQKLKTAGQLFLF